MTQEEEEVESSLPAASGFLSGGGAVTEETTATLSMSEYFTPPTESKKYDGKRERESGIIIAHFEYVHY